MPSGTGESINFRDAERSLPVTVVPEEARLRDDEASDGAEGRLGEVVGAAVSAPPLSWFMFGKERPCAEGEQRRQSA